MRTLRAILLAAAAIAAPVAPASAGGLSTASALSSSDRAAYRDVFAMIDAADWSGAAAKIEAMPDSPLKFAALAELYTAKGSPKVELDPLLDLLRKAPETAKAEQLARLAELRGATVLPPLPATQRLVWQGSQPRRGRAKGPHQHRRQHPQPVHQGSPKSRSFRTLRNIRPGSFHRHIPSAAPV